jgi:hypothetical protein
MRKVVQRLAALLTLPLYSHVDNTGLRWNTFNVRTNLLLKTGHAMAQMVSRRPVTAETRVRAQVSPCRICGGQSHIGTGFPSSSSVFPCQYQ